MRRESYLSPRSLTVLAELLPQWFATGDIVERRRNRLFAVSVSQTEPRYQQILRRLSEKIRKKGKR